MLATLAGHPLISALQALLPATRQTGKVYLVGGAVRDVLLGRKVSDFDFTSVGDPTPLAQLLSRRVRGHWFWLDEARRQSRMVAAGVTCDFAPFRAPSLAGDLAARDFTINAMALDLAGPMSPDALIDPLGGRQDLAGGLLRQAGPAVLHEDPLRIIKGIRHAVELDLLVDPGCIALMQRAAPRLPGVAGERLRLEIWRILAAVDGSRGLALLAEADAGHALFGPGFPGALPAMQQTLAKAIAALAELAAGFPTVNDWLCETVEQGLDRATMLRWCLVLGTIAPDLPRVFADAWYFSRPARTRIAALAQSPLQLCGALRGVPRRPRSLALWARQYGPDPIDLLLLLGIHGIVGGGVTQQDVQSILSLLAELPDVRRVEPLVEVQRLQELFGIDGAELGEVLAEIRRLEIVDGITDPDSALAVLLSRYPKKD